MTPKMPAQARAAVERVFVQILERRMRETSATAKEMYKQGASWEAIAEATGWDRKLCERVILDNFRWTYRVVDADE